MPDLEAVYRAHFSDVYRYALALSRNEQTAEEVTQATFFQGPHRHWHLPGRVSAAGMAVSDRPEPVPDTVPGAKALYRSGG